MKTKTIYVIIVTWNGMKWIQKCLDALRKSTYPVTTLMIDNLSTDDTVEYVKENYPEVRVIRSSKNLGFGQANNVGMRIALKENADYVYLLNQDAYVYSDMFEKLMEVAESDTDNQYGIFSPLHVHASKSKLDKQFKGYLNSISPDIVEDSFLTSAKNVYSVECVPAAGWLLPKRTLENIGGFDPIFFHYGEDHHYAQRVIYHGMMIGLVLSAKMIHDRDDFGNEALAKKNMVFRSLKTEIFLNINLSKPDRIRKLTNLFVLFTFQSLKELLHGNIYMTKEFQKSFVLNIINLRKYSKNRKQNKKVGPNWL